MEITIFLERIPLSDAYVIYFSYYSAKFWFKSATIKISSVIDLRDLTDQTAGKEIPDASTLWEFISKFGAAFSYCRKNCKINNTENIFIAFKKISIYNATAAFCAAITVFITIFSKICPNIITFFKWDPNFPLENISSSIFVTILYFATHPNKWTQKIIQYSSHVYRWIKTLIFPSTPEA